MTQDLRDEVHQFLLDLHEQIPEAFTDATDLDASSVNDLGVRLERLIIATAPGEQAKPSLFRQVAKLLQGRD
jgi:hypothetical protein